MINFVPRALEFLLDARAGDVFKAQIFACPRRLVRGQFLGLQGAPALNVLPNLS